MVLNSGRIRFSKRTYQVVTPTKEAGSGIAGWLSVLLKGAQMVGMVGEEEGLIWECWFERKGVVFSFKALAIMHT